MKIFDSLAKNKLSVFLFLLLILFVVREFGGRFSPVMMGQSSVSRFGVASSKMMAEDSAVGYGGVAEMMPSVMPVPPMDSFAPSASTNRLVVTDTSMSLVVNNVSEVIGKIEAESARFGGFLVDSSLNVPEGASSGHITVRVPSEKRLDALEAFRKMGVRVVSENVNGRDVTDEFEDVEARLAVLNKTKTKFEQILDSASEVQDLLSVQRELTNLQGQIDSLKGRALYLEQSAKLSRISVYLSTDELALPYSPDQVWRPQVVFKTAVRSLVGTLRQGLNGLIWMAVYSPVWLLALALGYFGWRRLSK